MLDFFNRLDKYMEYSGLNDNQLTIKTGIANGLIGKARKRGGLSSGNISKILEACTDLNAHWWFTGKGNMLVNESLSESSNIAAEPATNYSNIDEETLKKIEVIKGVFGPSNDKSIISKLDILIQNQTKILDRFDRELVKDNIERIKQELQDTKETNSSKS